MKVFFYFCKTQMMIQEDILKCLESLKNFGSGGKIDENTQTNGKIFENYVKNQFISIGYKEFVMDKKKDALFRSMLLDIKRVFKKMTQIKNRYNLSPQKVLVQQPYGSQQPPDMLLMNITATTIYFQPIEVKTGKKVATWNNTYPSQNWIYVFKGAEEVTYFKGETMLTARVQEFFEEYKAKRAQLLKEYNEKLESIQAGWKLIDYFKFEHSSKIDYTTDKEARKRRETSVESMFLEFASMSLMAEHTSSEVESVPPAGKNITVTIKPVECHESAVTITLHVNNNV